MPVKLNIGSNGQKLEGYTAIDRKLGTEAYPLDCQDASVDEIRASHVLEHFSHREVGDVLRDWRRALRPGGVLKVAVPNFEYIAKNYLDGEKINIQGYLMGGHVDDDDHHGCVFDEGSLTQALSETGFDVIGHWPGDEDDCSTLPVSLNLEAVRRCEDDFSKHKRLKVSAVMSVPRLGFMDNFFCAMEALPKLGIPLRKTTGAFWGQCLTRGIEKVLEEDRPDAVLTIDYDSVFTRRDVENLVVLMETNPDAAAIAALQSSRATGLPLMTKRGSDGKPMSQINRDAFNVGLTRVSSAHFGLTLINAKTFDAVPRPWFHATPDTDGGWGEGRVDDDVHFWRVLESLGLPVYQANRVPIGHLELMACWPGVDFQTVYQHPSEFYKSGKPEGAWQ